MKYKYNGEWVDLSIKALDSMVIGSIIQFVGTTIPTGWLECDGSTITQSEYPELYDLIGGTLPDFRGRVLVGQDTNDTDFDTLLETGGSKYLQEHSHEEKYESFGLSNNKSALTDYSNSERTITFNADHPSTGLQTGTTGTGNSGNLQPYAVVKHIIKTTNTTPTMASVVSTTNSSTTDAYSCDYVNNLVDYSTTEIKTGAKWIDGKPIYRKVINDTTSSSSDQTMLSTITNLDYCISMKGILVDSGYSIVIPSYVNSNNYTNCAMTDGKKPYLSVSSGYRSKAFTLIIEYTKTTD